MKILSRGFHSLPLDRPISELVLSLTPFLDDIVFLGRSPGADRMSVNLVELANSIEKRGLYDDVSQDAVLRMLM